MFGEQSFFFDQLTVNSSYDFDRFRVRSLEFIWMHSFSFIKKDIKTKICSKIILR